MAQEPQQRGHEGAQYEQAAEEQDKQDGPADVFSSFESAAFIMLM